MGPIVFKALSSTEDCARKRMHFLDILHAGSSASRSEIVVPVFDDEKVIALLDIDSAELNTFDSVDKEWLEKVCSLIQRCSSKNDAISSSSMEI